MGDNQLPKTLNPTLRRVVDLGRAAYDPTDRTVALRDTIRGQPVQWRFTERNKFIAPPDMDADLAATRAYEFKKIDPEFSDSVLFGGVPVAAWDLAAPFVPTNQDASTLLNPWQQAGRFGLQAAGTGIGTYIVHRTGLLPYLKYNLRTGLTHLKPKNLGKLFTDPKSINHAIDISGPRKPMSAINLTAARERGIQTLVQRTQGKKNYAAIAKSAEPVLVTGRSGFLSPRDYFKLIGRAHPTLNKIFRAAAPVVEATRPIRKAMAGAGPVGVAGAIGLTALDTYLMANDLHQAVTTPRFVPPDATLTNRERRIKQMRESGGGILSGMRER